MKDYKSICLLGRQPAIGLAELESLYDADVVAPIEGAALLKVPAEEINFKLLGGTVKTGKILNILPYTDWGRITQYLAENIPRHLDKLAAGKFTLGISVYGLKVTINDIHRSEMEIKKIIKRSGRPMRLVPNKDLALNAAAVLHNKLTHKGNWELLLIKHKQQTILAQTLFVQDIDAYTARDQARPKRDPRVGMLPPKLAQQIINLSMPAKPQEPKRIRILDPFCGTGVILQEALMMGYSVIGSDLDKRMVDYSTENIRWLFQKHRDIEGHVNIEQADATSYKWPRFTAVASELYLGQAFNSLPSEEKLKNNISTANTIIKKFLLNLAGQLKSNQQLCVAVPAWHKSHNSFVHLPLIANLTDMGYNRVNFKHVSNEDLLYFRENQIVARELLVLKRR